MIRLKYFTRSIYPIILLAIVICLFLFQDSSRASLLWRAIVFGLIVCSPLVIPGLKLYFNHIAYCSEEVATVYQSKQIEFKNGVVDDIKCIVKVQRDRRLDKYFDFLPWSSYFFYKLELVKGKTIYISCLSDVSKTITSVDSVIYKKFPSIEFTSNNDFKEILIKNKERLFWINKFKKKNTDDLLRIIENKKNYLPEAVDAAEKLLKERGVR